MVYPFLPVVDGWSLQAASERAGKMTFWEIIAIMTPRVRVDLFEESLFSKDEKRSRRRRDTNLSMALGSHWGNRRPRYIINKKQEQQYNGSPRSWICWPRACSDGERENPWSVSSNGQFLSGETFGLMTLRDDGDDWWCGLVHDETCLYLILWIVSL